MTQELWKLAWRLICQVQDLAPADQEAILRASGAPDEVLEHVREVLSCQNEPDDLAPIQAGLARSGDAASSGKAPTTPGSNRWDWRLWPRIAQEFGRIRPRSLFRLLRLLD